MKSKTSTGKIRILFYSGKKTKYFYKYTKPISAYSCAIEESSKYHPNGQDGIWNLYNIFAYFQQASIGEKEPAYEVGNMRTFSYLSYEFLKKILQEAV